MATYEKAKQYAQDSANRKNKVYIIKQSKNGQWLFAPCPESLPNGVKHNIIYPKNFGKGV